MKSSAAKVPCPVCGIDIVVDVTLAPPIRESDGIVRVQVIGYVPAVEMLAHGDCVSP